MSDRPFVLSIAGYDPCGGAGLLADIKTFEQSSVYGMGVCTALTVQHESVFTQVEWTAEQLITDQLSLLLQQYKFKACKIGLIKDWPLLNKICQFLKQAQPEIFIVVDPILRASAGFEFHDNNAAAQLNIWLQNIDLLTPNAIELGLLCPHQKDLNIAAQSLAKHCNVLFKGGHNETQKGTDILYYDAQSFILAPKSRTLSEKHGSGCVLSAAITAEIAKGKTLLTACKDAKVYISNYLASSTSLLGYHNQYK